MKTITNTLLIATILTSTLIASQPCIGTQCLASFAKPVAYKVTPTFKENSVEEKTAVAIQQPIFQEEIVTEEVVIFEPIIYDEVIEVLSENFIQPTIEYSEEVEISSITDVENIILETITEEEYKRLSTIETICNDGQESISCDITNQSTNANECVCV